MRKIYRQISLHTIPEKIVHQVKSLIKDGKLQPGEKLPPERTLADLFGVARSSLREAINILETLGFVEIKKRKGIFVRTVSSPIISDPLKQILEEDKSAFYKIYELRKDIELASSYLAAKLRNKTDLARLRKLLNRMKEDAHMSHISLSADLEFHIAIAQATHNFIRVHILKSIFDLSDDFNDFVTQRFADDTFHIAMVFAHHKTIFQAIQKKDQEGARAAMNEHLTWVEEEWKKFWTKNTKERPSVGRRKKAAKIGSIVTES